MVIRSLLLAAFLMAATNVQPAIAQSKSDAYCLALTVFTEARDQGEHGMALVAHTVLNRTKSRRKTVCQVAYAPGQYHGVLYWPKNKHPVAVNPKSWRTAMQVTLRVMRGEWDFGSCRGAEYFYAPKVVRRAPRWSQKLPFLCQHKGHRFYGTV